MDTPQTSGHWLQIMIGTQPETADDYAELLSESGAVAVTFQDSADEPIYEPLPGEERLWSNTQVIGLFEADTRVDDIMHHLQQGLGLSQPPVCLIKRLEDQDWERSWLDQFKPMLFGQQVWICPSHCIPPQPNAINIMLDPGLAFGTGTHPTTALCLEWLDQHPVDGQDVIDYGCGSGILAITAAKLGAKAIWAIDLDPQALYATRENALKNNVEDRIQTALPDKQPDYSCDLLIANILANPLIELATAISQRLNPGGQLVLSGILSEQQEAVSAAYRPWFTLQPVVERDNWLLIHGIKNN